MNNRFTANKTGSKTCKKVHRLEYERKILVFYLFTKETQNNTTTFSEAEGEVLVMYNRFKPVSDFSLLIVQKRHFCGGSYCFMSWC